MKRQLIASIASCAMLLASITPSVAAIEINETDFGPSYDTMLVDTIVSKPLGLVAAVAGTGLYLVSLPFSVAGGNSVGAQQKLLVEPWQAMSRCLGCTVAEDNYYKAEEQTDAHIVRIVVDQPSEILINTNDKVVVVPQ